MLCHWRNIGGSESQSKAVCPTNLELNACGEGYRWMRPVMSRSVCGEVGNVCVIGGQVDFWECSG